MDASEDLGDGMAFVDVVVWEDVLESVAVTVTMPTYVIRAVSETR